MNKTIDYSSIMSQVMDMNQHCHGKHTRNHRTCMLTMACYPRDANCAYHINFFPRTDILDKNNDHTFHYLAQ